MTTTGWPGKRSRNATTCSGLVAFSSESIGREWRTGACSADGAPTCSSGIRVGRELRMLDQERPELFLERVVLGVGDLRLAVVVRRAQLRQPAGEVVDALLHPSHATN